MVLTKRELIDGLGNEVRILLHLAAKVDRAKLDYRPTPRQRSTIELLRYLSMMGPALVEVARTGTFDPAAWTAAEQAAGARTLEDAVATIAAQSDGYAAAIGAMPDEDFRAEISPFGTTSARGAFIVNWVLAGCAAYRMQLFLYLKACGREDLGTSDLWDGVES